MELADEIVAALARKNRKPTAPRPTRKRMPPSRMATITVLFESDMEGSRNQDVRL